MESTVADFELGGRDPHAAPAGILRDVAPANAYPTADGHDVVIAGERRRRVRAARAMAMERPDLATELAYARGARRAPGRARRRDRGVDRDA